jgi:membrane protein
MPRPKFRFRELGDLLKHTASDWKEDKAARLAAALAYYTAISIAPLLVVIIAIAGMVLGEEAARGAILGELGGLVGHESAQTVESMIAAANRPRSGALATAFGIGVLIFGASGVFKELQDSLNTIWEVKPKPGQGLRAFIRKRFLSISMVFGTAFLLLVSLVVSTALSALGRVVERFLPGAPIIWQILGNLVSFGIVTLLFAMIFKFLPDVKIQFRDVWIGAVVTALLFMFGKFLLGLYLSRSSVTTGYGAAGSIVAMLLWVYYSAQIFFFGAEFTQAYARRYGSRIEPDEHATAVTEEERAQQGLDPGKPVPAT